MTAQSTSSSSSQQRSAEPPPLKPGTHNGNKNRRETEQFNQRQRTQDDNKERLLAAPLVLVARLPTKCRLGRCRNSDDRSWFTYQGVAEAFCAGHFEDEPRQLYRLYQA